MKYNRTYMTKSAYVIIIFIQCTHGIILKAIFCKYCTTTNNVHYHNSHYPLRVKPWLLKGVHHKITMSH